ncbi:hypothetical protein ACQP2Y_21400 [Actinoplanes sp. CA-051413]|uniref:hypothetical protein n=1 Tax=Actinoplanes sp. CA-051413 TaxID=3239899 RepID=UPI003D9526A7
MNDIATAEARRPSPRPRPAGAPSRPVDRPELRIVPPPPDDMFVDDPAAPVQAEACTLQPEADETTTPTAEFPQVNVNTDGAHPDPARSRVQALWASTRAVAGRTGAYWTPPALFTDQPASLAELADYARHAPWTAQNRSVIRKAGVVYHGGAYAYTVVSRYREWVVQRPGRLAVHLGAIKILALTTPGIWVVDHLVYPVAQFAGHLFL